MIQKESFQLFPHETSEGFFRAVVESLPPGGLSLRRFPVVVPTLLFRERLQIEVARRAGLCMGQEFLTPGDFLSRVPGPIAPGKESPWSPGHLQWMLLPYMPKIAGELGMRNASARDHLALAGTLADRFDQYGHFRPQMIRAWLNGKSGFPSNSPAESQESWQRELFLQASEKVGAPHPAMELERLGMDNGRLQALRDQFPELMVVGSIDPLLIEVLAMMKAAGCKMTLHMMLPSLGFLGHLKLKGLREKISLSQDPEEFRAEASHPLLDSMGRHAAGTFLMLGKIDDDYTHWPEPGHPPDRLSKKQPSHLNLLQSDIRGMRPPEVAEKNPHDISLRVHSCFGPRREMEALREELLRAFVDFPDLRPEDIHVATPSLEVYGPLVSAVLGQGGSPLPVRMTELPVHTGLPAVDAVLCLLRIAHRGRFTASELLDLADLPAAADGLGIVSDEGARDKIHRWVEESGLTHGMGRTPGSWCFARDRLVAGKWMGTDDSLRYPEQDFILPLADDLLDADTLLDRWLGWWELLEQTLRDWKEEVPAAAWAERLGMACEQLFSGEEDARFALRGPLDFLARVREETCLDAGAIGDWLESRVGDAARRTITSGAILFGRMRELQHLPCRVLAIVGLDEGVFPGQKRTPSWDLLHRDPRLWDRNPRIEDRQLFLDALLTPSDRLILSASNRNVRTGRDEPFSACVDELLRVTRAMGIEDVIVKHPLQPFSPQYFQGRSAQQTRTPSHDPLQAQICEALATGKNALFPVIKKKSQCTGETNISLGDLQQFWKDPAKAFLKARGIAIPGETPDDEALDRAPLSLDGLQKWSLKNAILSEPSKNPEALKSRFLADRGLAPGHVGERQWQESLKASQPLASAIASLRGEEAQLEAWVAEHGVTVRGSLTLSCKPGFFLACRLGQFKDPPHFLDPWISAVVASASGYSLGAVLLDEELAEKSHTAIDSEAARELLEILVQGYLEGRQHPLHFGPRTSDIYVRALAKKTPEEAIETARSEWFKEGFNSRGGEGLQPATQLAWRDLDPFEDFKAWDFWASEVIVPLNRWKQSLAT